MKIRVYYEDTDIAGVVYYANYFKFIERARSEIFFSQSVSPINGDSHFVVKSVTANFVSSARFADILDVKTELVSLKAATIELKQTVYKDDTLIFSADVKLAHLNQNKPAKIPESLRKLF